MANVERNPSLIVTNTKFLVLWTFSFGVIKSHWILLTYPICTFGRCTQTLRGSQSAAAWWRPDLVLLLECRFLVGQRLGFHVTLLHPNLQGVIGVILKGWKRREMIASFELKPTFYTKSYQRKSLATMLVVDKKRTKTTLWILTPTKRSIQYPFEFV